MAKRRSKKRPPKESWLAKALRRLLVLAFVMIALAATVLASVFWYYSRDLPTVETLRKYQPPQITYVYDRNGILIGELFNERRTVVPLSKIPRVMVLSVLAAEDADFYRHRGLDYPGILRALFRDIISGRRVQGASTITQQVVKNLLLSHERTFRRKIRELILARRLEQEMSKDEILNLYVNTIYFGHGRYGVQEASRFYFGKDVEKISLAEASLIAGIPQAPVRLSPRDNPEAAKNRQTFVLDQLQAKRDVYWSDLSEEEIAKARDTQVKLSDASKQGDRAPELVRQVRAELNESFGEDRVKDGGFRVTTTLDLALQIKVRNALRAGLRDFDHRHGAQAPFRVKGRKDKNKALGKLKIGKTYWAQVVEADDEKQQLHLKLGEYDAVVGIDSADRYNPKQLSASKFAKQGVSLPVRVLSDAEDSNIIGVKNVQVQLDLGPQGAAIVMNPATREVLAMVGNYSDDSGFDRASQALRQPGSAFKPIVYAYAIQSRRFTPASIVLDAPEVFDKYMPKNYETWNFQGAVRLRYALAKSINLVAIRVIEELGPKHVAEFGHQLGISTPLEESLPLALGASAVFPIELVNAYATFASGGVYEKPKFIRRILDSNGERVELPRRDEAVQVLSPAEAYVVTSMLTSVVRIGTATAAQSLGTEAAGKTGTSNRARDAWFVGYTPNTLAGVWVGFDNNRPLGRGESGGRTALPVWIDVIRSAEGQNSNEKFVVPPGVMWAKIDPESGKLAYEGMPDAIDEVFLEGTVPSEMALDPSVADPTDFMMEQQADTIDTQ
ncbi:MAG: PBP1A family penicillin-binding protein [Myxococcales bacterium]|nr:MAG: PBP1A family penicillin-binding protein [Myxococcales bacterium]